MGQPVERARGELVAGAGGVDHRPLRMSPDNVDLVVLDDDGAGRSPGQEAETAILSSPLQRVVEVLDFVQRPDLGVVREEDVDRGSDQLEKLGAVPLDAELVRKRERHLVARVCARRA